MSVASVVEASASARPTSGVAPCIICSAIFAGRTVSVEPGCAGEASARLRRRRRAFAAGPGREAIRTCRSFVERESVALQCLRFGKDHLPCPQSRKIALVLQLRTEGRPQTDRQIAAVAAIDDREAMSSARLQCRSAAPSRRAPVRNPPGRRGADGPRLKQRSAADRGQIRDRSPQRE